MGSRLIYNLVLLIGIVFSSCASYSYSYSRKTNSIKAIGRHRITDVYIYDEHQNAIAYFKAVSGEKSNSFSLSDFSPGYFKCYEGCDLVFKKDSSYFFLIHPRGDVAVSPMLLKADSLGKMKDISGTAKFW